MVWTAVSAQACAMTTTPPEAPSGPPPQDPTGGSGPRVTRDEVRDLGRLRRSTTDRKVAGVAGGLGRHLDVDPLILRVAFVVLVFFGGAGLIVYGACWLLVPEDGDDKAPFNLDERTRTVALMIVGAVAALALIGDSWGAFWFPWPVAIVALIALWLLTRNNTSKDATPPAVAPYDPTYAPSYVPAAPAQENPYAAAPPPVYYPPQPPPYVAPPVVQRVPRKRGPILFWFTLALIALAEGLLGIADLAGADIADPAYPALAVAICGVMLVVGAFFGRAGGIILAGLIATVGLAGTTAASEWDGDQVAVTPTTAASLDNRYWLDAGEQVIDLRHVTDLSSLDGRTLEVEGGVGRIEVILPDGLAATVSADVDGPGNIELFGEEHGGIDVNENDFDGSDADPEIFINAQLGVGQIEVHR
jgi:phage shock protein PspC (stress-responsive transcriptional regulator)